MRRFYYKMRQLLQNATFITNCDSTHNINFGIGIYVHRTSKILKTLVEERNIVVVVVRLHETQLILNSSIILMMDEFITIQMVQQK